jgi:hypothetical protein
MVNARQPVCTGRTLIKHKRGRSIAEGNAFFECLDFVPFGKHFLFDGGQVQFGKFSISRWHISNKKVCKVTDLKAFRMCQQYMVADDNLVACGVYALCEIYMFPVLFNKMVNIDINYCPSSKFSPKLYFWHNLWVYVRDQKMLFTRQ